MSTKNELKARSSRGATRKAVSASRRRSFNVKPFLCVALLLSLPFIAIEAWQLARTAIDRPVGRVVVEGDFRFVDQVRISDLVMTELNEQGESGNFFALDLELLQQHLQADIWVDVAQVGRRWPDVLVVRVQEHQPIARWSDEGFLNVRGDIIVAAVRPDLLNLPLLQGEAGKEQEVMAQYQRLSGLLRLRELAISHLQQLATGVWRMQVQGSEGSIEVLLGREQVIEKIQRMLLVFDSQLQHQHENIERIDLRYSNGVAVSWRSEDIKNIENS